MKKNIFKILILEIFIILSLTSFGQEEKIIEKKSSFVKVNQELYLKKGNWYRENYVALNNLINKYGKNNSSKEKFYAVFDWDNTTIINDVEEALLAYQLENLEFKMNPKEFKETIETDIPKKDFLKDFNNKDNKSVNIDKIVKDVSSDYKYLYDNYNGMKGKKTLEEIKKTLEYKDFIVKMRYVYKAIGGSFSADISYPWVTYLFKGMTQQEVAKLTEKSNDLALQEKLQKVNWTSPGKLPGEAGVVSVNFIKGIRLVKEQQNLYEVLMKNGIDVYICSASFIDVVREFATNPKYGYNVPSENIYAMQLKRDENGVILADFDHENYFQTQGKGKTKTIKKYIVPKYGNRGPILVAGDSSGDVAMLTDFKDTKMCLIINRVKGGALGKISKIAVETSGKENVRYYLQGRDNNTGEFINSESSILLGEKRTKLLH